MSSALESALSIILQNNYLSLAMVTTVGYDYVLVLPQEIEYIWAQPWTWVTTLFILVRYCGLYNFIVGELYGSSFIPGPTSEALAILEAWTYILFMAAANFIMILRVWAMWNRSRHILRVLLLLFSIATVSVVLSCANYSNPKNVQWSTSRVLDYSICTTMTQSASTMSRYYVTTSTLQMTFSTVLCMLAIAQFVRQSLQMHRATNQWQPNQYINLLVRQGILYFVAGFLLFLVSVLGYWKDIPRTGWQAIIAETVQYVPLVTLTPRFIISIRALYARDVQGRVGDGIDTGFGLSMLSSRADVDIASIVFASENVLEEDEIVEDAESQGTETIHLALV